MVHHAISRFACKLTVLAVGTMWCRAAALVAQAPAPFKTDRYTGAVQQKGWLVCPGGFPSDLTVTNCDFTGKMRVEQWVTTSITDQAALGAVVYGAGAWIIKSPGEWGRTWKGLGDRVGVRYTQSAGRGLSEFLMGAILQDDPRHVSYKDDPRTHFGDKITHCRIGEFEITHYPVNPPSNWTRIGHAFLDSVTVRRSNPCGIGRRLPALDRFVGIAAGAYAGYPWYPRAENTLPNAGLRAAGALGSTVVGSFYVEYSPEISLLLTRLFAKKSSPQSAVN